MNIIGISCFFHDAACCLLRDGVLVAAAEEERFSRVKFDPSLPIEAFQFCLRQGGLQLGDIDCVAYYEDPFKKFSRQIWMMYPAIPDGETLRKLDPSRVEREIRNVLGFSGSIVFVDHHTSHAASSFYFSGFDHAAIITMDGVGEWATTTYGCGEEGEITLFEEVSFPDSLGLLYNTITSYLGFSVNEDEYKVMGLAPYGRPKYVESVRRLVKCGAKGQYTLDMRYFDFLGLQRMYSDALVELFGQPARENEAEITEFHQDLACSLQYVLEEILLAKLCYVHEETRSENLCMAGGVALNCVANGRIRRQGPFQRIFVQPAANDAGGCLGAAAIAHMNLAGNSKPVQALEHVYLGPQFSNAEVAELLASAGLQAVDYRGREDDLFQTVACRLDSGQVVGWFQGRMEFGPRALGSRSILADPRNSSMRDHVNRIVKKREAFRPFAPAVLEAKAREHFDLSNPAAYMLETCQVCSNIALPAVTHVDGSARVQTVSDQTNPRFARLLRAFADRTGCPILLNTSFNVRGEPIVCSPVDALGCLMNSNLDALVLEDFLIDGSSVRERPVLSAVSHPPAVSHAVYTFM